MDQDFTGKVAVVTGGGLGIGRTTARMFAERGARVVVADVNDEESLETVRLITEAGGEALYVRTDVSQAADVEAMVHETVKAFNRLDCAFNNAGIGGQSAKALPTAEWSEASFDAYMAVNLKGVWLCMRQEILQMEKQGYGAIVNMSSGAGLVGVRHLAPYAATKHGVLGLTKTAGAEYGAKGIRINAVCPGVILTERIKSEFVVKPELEHVRHAAHPLGRMGDTREVAEAVLWLCSDASTFVIGHGLSVDGGYVIV